MYESTEQANTVFGELFQILSEDETFTNRLRETGLTAKLVHKKPDCTIFIAPGEVLITPEDYQHDLIVV